MSNLETSIVLRAKVDEFVGPLREASGEFRQAVDDVRAGSKDLVTVGQSATEAASKTAQLGDQAQAAAPKLVQVGQSAAEAGSKTGDLGRQAQTAAPTVDRLGQSATSTAQAFKDFAVEAAAAMAPVAAMALQLRGSAGAAKEFDTAMREVSTLLSDTSGIDALSGAVRDLTRTYGGDAAAQARALYQVISSGTSDATAATRLLDQANRLAVGGVTDVTTAADGLTNALNAYRLGVDQAESVSDAFFVAMRAGKTTVGELAGSLSSVAPMAAQAGVGIQDLLGAAAALTTTGTGTSEAMTQLRGILSAVIKPAEQAKSVAEQLGIAFDLQSLRAKGLAGFLEELKTATGGNEAQMAALFGSVEALNGVLSLTGAQSEAFAAILGDMEDRAGATDTAFDRMTGGSQASLDRFRAAMGDLAISTGDLVLAFTPLLDALTAAVNWFNGLPEPIRQTALALGGAAAVLASVAIASKGLSVAIATLKANLAMVGGTAAVAGAGIARVGVSAATATPQVLAFGRALRAIPILAAIALLTEGAAMFLRWRDAARAAREEADAQAQAERERAAEIEILNGQIGEQILRTDDARTVQEQLTAAIEDGTIVLDDATGSYRLAGQALQDYITAAQAAAQAQLDLTRAEVEPALRAQAQAIVDQGLAALDLATKLQAVIPPATDAQASVKGIVSELDLLSVADIGTAVDAIALLRTESEAAANTVQDALLARIKDLNGVDLSAFAESLALAFDAGKNSAQELANLNEGVLQASFKALGLSADEALLRIPTASERAAEAMDALQISLSYADLSAEQFRAGMTAALEAAIPKAQTLEDLDRMAEYVANLAEEGGVATEKMEDLQRALDRQRATIEAMDPAVRRLEEAYRHFGLTSPRAMQEAADAARENYSVLKESQAPLNALRTAFGKYAQAAIAANNGVVNSSLRAEAAQLGLKIEADESGRVIVSAMNQAAAATANVTREARAAAVEYRGMADAAVEAADAVERAADTEQRRAPTGERITKIDPAKIDDLEKAKKLLQAELGNVAGFAQMGYIYQSDTKWLDAMKARIAQLEKENKEQEEMDRMRKEIEMKELRARMGNTERIERESRPEERPLSYGRSPSVGITQPAAPDRIVRIELGNATVDAPERQADALIRELQRVAMRTSR
jgi:TP901 family phage tail tape measure protein